MKPQKIAGKPEVSAFWVFNGEVIGDSIPVDKGEDYGDFVNYPDSHWDVWDKLQQAHLVPKNLDYSEVPRGRIIYNREKRIYYLFADRCLLDQPALISKIISTFHLPTGQITTEPDSHYNCPGCAKKRTKTPSSPKKRKS